MKKPECEICKEKEIPSSLFGEEMIEKLLYGLFNPEVFPQEQENSDLDSLVEKYLSQNKQDTYLRLYFPDEETFLFYCYLNRRRLQRMGIYSDRQTEPSLSELEESKEKAWNELKEKIRKGEIDASKLPLKKLMKHFYEKIMEELEKQGYLEGEDDAHYPYKYFDRPYHSRRAPTFTPKAEKLIAQKVLEEVLARLEKHAAGSHEIEDTGLGNYPSHLFREYDDFMDSYDMLDVQETLLTTARRDPVDMQISDKDLKVKVPLHKTKSSNVILIDKSGSMYWQKITGAKEAALGLKELLETEYKEDSLRVIAYDSQPYSLEPGQIVNLTAHGWTDIGCALDTAIEILVKEEANRNIFLITDSEPTISFAKNVAPEESALRAAHRAGEANIRLNIIMLDNNPELRHICEQVALLNRNATVAYVDNPLNLKEFVIKSYIERMLK